MLTTKDYPANMVDGKLVYGPHYNSVHQVAIYYGEELVGHMWRYMDNPKYPWFAIYRYKGDYEYKVFSPSDKGNAETWLKTLFGEKHSL